MGEDVLRVLGLSPQVLGSPSSEKTGKDDTVNAAEAMLGVKPDLIVFTGGDGTAVDVMSVVGDRVPILGIPSGVKMYSGVFGTTPRATGELLRRFIACEASVAEREVMDQRSSRATPGRRSSRLWCSTRNHRCTRWTRTSSRSPSGSGSPMR